MVWFAVYCSSTLFFVAIGHDGQAVMMTGTKMSSAKSHESSSSMSARQVTGANGESVIASSSSHRSQSSSSQKSSSITMTSAAGSGSLTRSLLTSSQVKISFFKSKC